MWRYVGRDRPDFAEIPREGQESVWDYPRPPAIVPDERRVVVRFGEIVVAESGACLRVLETASPPTFYLPPADVREDLLAWNAERSYCEWKGTASYCDLVIGSRRIPNVGWRYARPGDAFRDLQNYVSFYPAKLDCFVDGERVEPQPGGFYGGWMTSEISGPVKGGRGTGHW